MWWMNWEVFTLHIGDINASNFFTRHLFMDENQTLPEKPISPSHTSVQCLSIFEKMSLYLLEKMWSTVLTGHMHKKKEVTWLASKETSLPSLNSVGLENAHQNLLGSYDTNYAWKRLYKDCSVDKFWFRPRFRKVCTRWVWSLQRNGVKVWLLLNKVQAGWKTSCFIFQDYFWFDSFRGLRQYQLGWIKFGTESRCL